MSRSATALALLALLSCSQPRVFTEQDLPTLALQADEAPVGTTLDRESTGFQTLEQYAEDDDKKKQRFEAAGFKTSYFSVFVVSGTRKDPTPVRSLAISFGMLFDTDAGAARGLTALEQEIREEGRDIADRPSRGLGEDAFGLRGILEPRQLGKPFGYIFAWKTANAIFGFIATGDPTTLDEGAIRRALAPIEVRTTA